MITPSTAESRADLERLLDSGFEINFQPRGIISDRPLRHAAVLILFGSLDRILAGSPVTTVPPELDVLLMRRSEHLRSHPGQISFPGGGQEPEDANLVATALREAAEETRLDPAGVDVLGALPPVLAPVSNHLVTPVLGWWASPTPVRADGGEAVDVFRTPVAELLDPSSRGTSVIDRGDRVFRGEAFKLQRGPVVWGFTGILLSRLFDGLGWTVPWEATREFRVLP